MILVNAALTEVRMICSKHYVTQQRGLAVVLTEQYPRDLG